MTHATKEPSLGELKPCPFCGETLRVVPQFYDRDFREQKPVYIAWHSGVVTDRDCMFSGKGILQDRWDLWNTRANSPEHNEEDGG